MRTQILSLLAAGMIASGCVVNDTASRSTEPSAPYGSSDEPFPVLNAYGNWIDIAPYGRVWQPAVMPDWRPYTNGRWVWTDRGWMWDSEEPFGWVVYHYGYWTEMGAMGWVWIPGNDWSPARVNWYSGNDYIGWAPMPPPNAYIPEAYQSGYENYWVVVPAPQFTRLNVGAYRVTPRQPPPASPTVNRGRGVERPPDIITIQGATHQLISPRKTEQEDVRNGRRTVARVRVAPDDRTTPAPSPSPVPSPGPASPVYVSPARPDVLPPPSAPVTLPGGARIAPRTPTPAVVPPHAVVPPPAVQPRPVNPIRIAPTPAPAKPAPDVVQPGNRRVVAPPDKPAEKRQERKQPEKKPVERKVERDPKKEEK